MSEANVNAFLETEKLGTLMRKYSVPCIISLLREYTDDVRFTDAVDIPGLVEPEFHESVHIEVK